MVRSRYILLISLFCVTLGLAQEPDKHVLPHRDALATDIYFWKQIFGRLSLNQYRIHDSEHLAIHYKTVTFDTSLTDKQREDALDGIKEQIDDLLVKLHKKEYEPGSLNRWEQTILTQFEQIDAADKFVKARKRIRAQQGIKENFLAGVTRSGAYLAHIREVFAEKGLPDFLVYLPHIESSFNPKAVSHVGAAGMWQFMPRTARDFMKVNKIIDVRFDPYKATYGAAKLLKWNYRKLNDWALAITAYNHGLGSMLKAKRRYSDYLTIREKYLRRSFGFASKNFYPELLAVVEMMDSSQYYFPGIEFDSAWVYQEIKLPVPVKLKEFATSHSLDIDEMRSLNPAYRRRAWADQVAVPAGYTLRLPLAVDSEPILAALTPADQSPGTVAVVNRKKSNPLTSQRLASADAVNRQQLRSLLRASRAGVMNDDEGLPVPALGSGSWVQANTIDPAANLLLAGGDENPGDSMLQAVTLPKAKVGAAGESPDDVLMIALNGSNIIDQEQPGLVENVAEVADASPASIDVALDTGVVVFVDYRQLRPFPGDNIVQPANSRDLRLNLLFAGNAQAAGNASGFDEGLKQDRLNLPQPVTQSFAALDIPASAATEAIAKMDLIAAGSESASIDLRKPAAPESVGGWEFQAGSAESDVVALYELWADGTHRTPNNSPALPRVASITDLRIEEASQLIEAEEAPMTLIASATRIVQQKPDVAEWASEERFLEEINANLWMAPVIDNDTVEGWTAFQTPQSPDRLVGLQIAKRHVLSENDAYAESVLSPSAPFVIDQEAGEALASQAKVPSAVVADSLFIVNGGALGHVASGNVRLSSTEIRRHLIQRLRISGDEVTVFPQETIGHLSEWLQTSPRLLRQRNQISARQKLLTGQRLTVSFANAAPEVFLERRVSYHMALMNELLQHSNGIELVRHTVRSGENFWNLSRKRYKFPVNLLLYFNDLDKLDKLYPGDIIMLPVTFN